MTSNFIVKTATILLMAITMLTASLSAIYAYNSIKSSLETTPFDMHIFVQQGLEFWENGQLYQRSDNIKFLYRPAAPVFKFPPAYQLYIAPWLKHGIPENFYQYFSLIYLAMYASSVILLCKNIVNRIKESLDIKPSIVFLITIYGVSASIACLFQPFHEGLWLLTAEIPIFLLSVLAFLSASKTPRLAGIALAIAATAKIYPVFLLIHFYFTKNLMLFFGFLIGSILITLLTIFAFGTPEISFYLTAILPTLLNEDTRCTYETLNIVCFFAQFFEAAITYKLANALSLVIQITVLAYIALLYQSNKNGSPLAYLLLYSAVMAAMLMVMPNYWAQYQIFLLIPGLTAFAISLLLHLPVTLAITLLTCISIMCGPEMQESALWFYYGGTVEQLYARAEQIGEFGAIFEASKTALLISFFIYLKPLAPYILLGITTRLLMNLKKPLIERGLRS